MDELVAKIQIVINTLGVLELPPTFANVNHMTGIYQMLNSVKSSLAKKLDEAEANTGEEAET